MPASAQDQNRILIRLLGLPAGTLHPTTRQLLGLHTPSPGPEDIDRALGIRLRQLRAAIPPQFRPILFYVERQLQEAAAELKKMPPPAISSPVRSSAHTPPAGPSGIPKVPPPHPVLKPNSPPVSPTKVPPAKVTRPTPPKNVSPSAPKSSHPPVPPRPQTPQAFGLHIDPDAVAYRLECAQDEPVAELKYELWDQLDRWLKSQQTK